MFNLNSLQNLEAMLAIASGVLLAIVIAMSYMMIWIPRNEEGQAAETRPSLRATWRSIPWVLVLSYAGIFGFGILYTLLKIKHPPNW